MTDWFVQTLRTYPEIAIFLSLALGYYFGSFTYKGQGQEDGYLRIGAKRLYKPISHDVILPIDGLLLRGVLDLMCPRTAVTEFRQRLRAHQLQTFSGVVAMDFLDVELAHEVDGFLGNDLAGHHDREAGRVGDDEVRRDQIGTALQATVDLLIVQTDVLASGFIIGGIEAAADVALVGLVSGVAAEAVVEARKVRQIGHVRHQTLDAGGERAGGVGAALGDIPIDLAADLRQHTDQIGAIRG